MGAQRLLRTLLGLPPRCSDGHPAASRNLSDIDHLWLNNAVTAGRACWFG
jgi:hypothetical protein